MNAFQTILRSLNFQEDRRSELRAIGPDAWPKLLEIADRARITLPLGARCRGYLPDSVQNRIDRNLADNVCRYQRMCEDYRWIAAALQSHSVDFILLKGLSQIAPYYVDEPRARPQYDIDLYCAPHAVEQAWNALLCAGYVPVREKTHRTDHFPPMIRNWDWQWRGDYYAIDLPLTVELHFQFWDPQTERIPAPFIERFWRQRVTRVVDDLAIPMLSLADSVSYSALHLMRHLFRGDLRVYHVYELAHFLHQTERDDELWNEWRSGRADASPPLEAVAFRLAVEWFGCRTHAIVSSEIEVLPARVRQWFDLFRFSPLQLDWPNKDELLLHLSLVSNPVHRCAILGRRLLPLRGLKFADPNHKDKALLARRAGHHLRSALPLARSFFLWKASGRKYAVS